MQFHFSAFPASREDKFPVAATHSVMISRFYSTRLRISLVSSLPLPAYKCVVLVLAALLRIYIISDHSMSVKNTL